jgi:hypothetical protein
MKNSRFVALIAVSLLLYGCTTHENRKWIGVGGSKADGVVVLGIEIPPKMYISETMVDYDIEQANSEADRRCKNWGYAGAEIFRNDFPVLVVCHPQGFSPCWSKTYRATYQCLEKK